MDATGEYRSLSPAATEAWGRALARLLGARDFVALRGDLGAGKSCLARGIGRGLGVPDTVPIASPTFTLVQSYEGENFEFHHFDFYRVSDFEELEAMGYRDYLDDDAVVVVEWPELVSEALPSTRLEAWLEGEGDERMLRWFAYGWSDERIEALRGIMGQAGTGE